MIGELTSLDGGPKRNVEVSITPSLLSLGLAKPRGAVAPSEVKGLIVERRRWFFRDVIRLWLQTDAGNIDFYRTRPLIDIALLLDELEAAIVPRPSNFKSIKEVADRNIEQTL